MRIVALRAGVCEIRQLQLRWIVESSIVFSAGVAFDGLHCVFHKLGFGD
jgi:hypothetical protein